MIVKKISLTGLRVFEQAEFSFQSGMNLIVGVNGAGKSTTLDALRIVLSRIIPSFSDARTRIEPIEEGDINIGKSFLQISCNFAYNGSVYNYLINKQSSESKFNRPNINRIYPAPTDMKNEEQPLVLFFSTRRSYTIEQNLPNPPSGKAFAYYEAFSPNRDFNTRMIADWMRVQIKLAEKLPNVENHLNALRQTLNTFLPNYSNLRVERRNDKNHLMIEKAGQNFNVKQLSDGERGVLAIVLEIARRLSIANPELENPIQNGKGVILIDELDLHLHPKWQRTVVKRLTQTFPSCQFICTTHSPQIIGEVQPDRITIIDDGEVFKPNRSFGIDSSRILEEIMETQVRNTEVSEMLSQLFDLIDDERLEEGKSIIKDLAAIIGENDPEINRAKTLIEFLEGDL